MSDADSSVRSTVLFLTRQYFPDGTNGRLLCAGKLVALTIELPWQENKRGQSCIPEGNYTLHRRCSRKFGWHMEVAGVEKRDMILIHPANNAMQELKGCIAPVTKISGPGMGLQSRKAFAGLKRLVYAALDRNEEVVLIVES